MHIVCVYIYKTTCILFPFSYMIFSIFNLLLANVQDLNALSPSSMILLGIMIYFSFN